MNLRGYTFVWVIIAIGFSVEYFFINFGYWEFSIIFYLKDNVELFKDLNTDISAGRPISYYLGWTGFISMCLTNLYILRKRMSFMHKWGRLKGWLDFHIFLGLLGPTLIIFHTNFKVGGLVALSFWSMMIVAISGILGRYFYIQTVTERSDLEKIKEESKAEFVKMAKEAEVYSDSSLQKVLAYAAQFVGVVSEDAPIPATISASIKGDLNIKTGSIPIIKGMPRESRKHLASYALSKRRIQSLGVYQKLLGYWHSFHLPFAFVMYIAAIIHIIVALLFQVK